MNKMLINATQGDEVRVALVKDQLLYDLDIEQVGSEQKKSNIYKGKISRIEPSLEAAFVEYGTTERHGFLPFKEVARSYLKAEQLGESFSKLNIRDVFCEGQEVLVQIDKEERGNKGAALTTFISLAGSYLVLMPNNPRVGGISRHIDGKDRDEMRDLLRSLEVPEGMGVIIRTAGLGKSAHELKWDLEFLLKRWQEIEQTAKNCSSPSLVYQEGDAVIRAVRDYLRPDVEEILVDNAELFRKAKSYLAQARPDFVERIKLYQGKVPLFALYQIEKQIETAYQRVVRLPSGGSISIDHTEALISIDVNSAKATRGGDIEETAFNTNLEAAEEIARQLRIRDIGGLIVIDFIDMAKVKHQHEVSRRLRVALEYDRARVQVGQITRFGLLEMSRQRMGSHLGAAVQVTCPRCEGQGSIRSVESLHSSVIRVIEEEAAKKDTSEVQVQLPIELATMVFNEKRELIHELTQRLGVKITILPNQYLATPQYQVRRLKLGEVIREGGSSYNAIETPELNFPAPKAESSGALTDPLIKSGFAAKTSIGCFKGTVRDFCRKIWSGWLKRPKTESSSSGNRGASSGVTAPTKGRSALSASGEGRSSTGTTRRYSRSRNDEGKARRSSSTGGTRAKSGESRYPRTQRRGVGRGATAGVGNRRVRSEGVTKVSEGEEANRRGSTGGAVANNLPSSSQSNLARTEVTQHSSLVSESQGLKQQSKSE